MKTSRNAYEVERLLKRRDKEEIVVRFGFSDATVVYSSLEEVHVLALAHVLKRPIIVVADTTLNVCSFLFMLFLLFPFSLCSFFTL